MLKITSQNVEEVFKSKVSSIEKEKLKGYEVIDTLFCDSSGWGGTSEPALTAEQLKRKIAELTAEHGVIYTAITDQGQFQVYITVFKKASGNRASRLAEAGLVSRRKVANNTYEVTTVDGERKIILHDTAVVTFTRDGQIILDSGGWHTVTTKDRINRTLRENGLEFELVQFSFDWYLVPSSFEVPKGMSFGRAVKFFNTKFYDGIRVDSKIEAVTK